MKRRLLLLFLISSVLCSARAEVVFPGANRTVEAASFLPSALEELEEQGTYVLFDQEGIPYGFVDQGEFTSSIDYGGLTITPSTQEGEGVVVGGSSTETSAEELAALRQQEGTDVDWDMLRQQDFLKYAYYSARYDGLEDYLQEGLGVDSKQEALDLMESLDASEAGELQNIFDALEDGEVGYSHYQEVLEALEQMDMGELEKHLDPETMERLEEFMDEVGEQAARRALDEILRNVGEEELEVLYELLKHLDYGTIYEIARDYTREMARDGTLDDIGNTLKDTEIPNDVRNQFAKSTGDFLRRGLWEILPENSVYYMLAVALLVTVWALRRVGG